MNVGLNILCLMKVSLLDIMAVKPCSQ